MCGLSLLLCTVSVAALAESSSYAGLEEVADNAASMPSPAAVAPSSGSKGGALPRVHITGTSRIDAHVGRSAGEPVLSGSVTDDGGRAVPGVLVDLTVASTRADSRVDVPLASSSPESCDHDRSRPIVDSANRILLTTDDSGRFCVRVVLSSESYVARFETRATLDLAAAVLDTPFDLARKLIALRFEPQKAALSLDDDEVPLDVAVSSEDDTVSLAQVAGGLAIHLTNESGTRLGESTTLPNGRAHFLIPGGRLGPAGYGELRAVFDGTSELGGAAGSESVERRTRVRILAPEAHDDRLPMGSSDEGVAVRIVAEPSCAATHCAAIPTGVVELRVGGVSVGSGNLHGGTVQVTATLAVETLTEIPLEVVYTPDARWFLASGSERWVQPIRPPAPWGKIATVVAGLAVLAWFLIPRLPSVRRGDPPCPPPRETAIPETRWTPGAALDGYTGRVFDAHDGAPIDGVSVRIERPGFNRADVVAVTVTSNSGLFVLAPVERKEGDQLVFESFVYVEARRALPTYGHVEIGIIHRKRALLERLVAWAKARDGRFGAKPEPTPAQVRLAAGADTQIGHWAAAVETAMYGQGVIDALAQSEIDRLAPDATGIDSRETRTASDPDDDISA